MPHEFIPVPDFASLFWNKIQIERYQISDKRLVLPKSVTVYLSS
jgi:hypothetical protein